ncbi:MAG: hypothetical protein IKF82_05415 [Bacilli bacterium]|nr:hypothetical protein [Bacilli bacterium]
MFNKRFMLILIFFVSLLAISSVSAQENTFDTLTHDNIDDTQIVSEDSYADVLNSENREIVSNEGVDDTNQKPLSFKDNDKNMIIGKETIKEEDNLKKQNSNDDVLSDDEETNNTNTSEETNATVSKNNVIEKVPLSIKASKLSTTYKSGKYFQAKIINSKTKEVVKGVKVIIKVYTGKKTKTLTLTSNSKGIIKYSSSKLGLGKHKIILKVKDSKNFKGTSKISSIKVSKASLKISAPAVTNIYKKSGKFKVTVKNKASGTPVKGIKVTMKVYTGKKYKTYTLKTKKNGVVSFNTKSLSKTKHKVVITAKGTSKYKKSSAKSSVEITNKMPTKIVVENKSIWRYRDPFSGIYRTGGEFTPILKDKYGHKIKGNYEADVWVGSTREAVIKNKFGERGVYYSYGLNQYKVVITFAGNSKYKASEVTIMLT